MEDKKDISTESPLQENGKRVADAIEENAAVENAENLDDFALPPELLEELPPKSRKVIRSIMSMTMSSRGGMPSDPELLKQQDEHQFEIAKMGIGATKVDRQESREHDLKKFKIRVWIYILAIVGVTGLCVLAMYTGNTAFIIELWKAISYTFGGVGVGGVIIFKKLKND
jgi:hypothetical protein